MDINKQREIIALAALSMDLLEDLAIDLSKVPNKTLSSFINDWKFKNQINEKFSIVNQGVILTHLYGLIILPKEVYEGRLPKQKLDMDTISEWGGFNFIKLPEKLNGYFKKQLNIQSAADVNQLTLEFLIVKLRNSISHGSVKISTKMEFTFVDNDDKSEVFFSILGLQQFCNRFRKYFAKLP